MIQSFHFDYNHHLLHFIELIINIIFFWCNEEVEKHDDDKEKEKEEEEEEGEEEEEEEEEVKTEHEPVNN